MPLPEKFLNEVVERNDIVDVVSGYVNLDKRSGANRFGLCPFHGEKTPSFSVSPSKQIYHCFGCGKGGGVINFIMEIENVNFREAVELLASRAGLTMPEEEESAEAKQRKRILFLNRDAARFFHDQLYQPSGKAALDYVYGTRHISKKTATDFGLGFAPDSWSALTDAMKELGYSEKELLAAGLAKQSEKGRVFDAFRDRLMFPIINTGKDVIGFSGRALSDKGPKYYNSPETPVFDKGRNLFALNLAKKSKSDYFILAEGNVDVVMLHQAGFDSAVASLGTSLTTQQAQLMSRFKESVVIAYDGDDAGKKAIERAIPIFDRLGMKVKVINMGDAKDPDEFIKKNGSEAFRRLIEGSKGKTDYLLQEVEAKYDLSVPDQRVAFLTESVKKLAKLPNIAEREVYASVLHEKTGVKKESIIGEIEQARKALKRSADRAFTGQILRDGGNSYRDDDPASAAAESGIIGLLFLDPSLVYQPGLPDSGDFTSPDLKAIYSLILSRLRSGLAVSVATLGEDLSRDQISRLVHIIDAPVNLSDSAEALQQYIDGFNRCRQLKSSDLITLIGLKQQQDNI